MKKVLVLLPCLDLGGAEKQGFYIAKSLKESGLYDVEVCALVKNTGTLIVNLEEVQIKYNVLDIPFSAFNGRMSRVKAYIKFLTYLWRKKFDAIIPYTYHCNVISATTYRFAGVNKCLWFQIAMEYHVPYTFFEKVARFFAPTYAANSSSAAGFIAHRHSINKNDIKIIPNPFEIVPTKNDESYWLIKLKKKEGEIIAFMAANFFPEKDHLTVLRGLTVLLQTHPNLKFVFAGGPITGVTVHMLKSYCFDNKLQDNVFFLGSIDDIPGILKVVDIGLLSSKSEGSPNSVLEYMGYGIPVLATMIPPIAELFEPGYPYLFKVGDVDDFVEKTHELIVNLNTINSLVERNKQFVFSNFTIHTNYAAFQSLLSK